MKEHWKLSKEALLSTEEGRNHEEEVKCISRATQNKYNCGTLINIVKLVLYIELLLLLAGSCFVLWQTYYGQSSKTSLPPATVLQYSDRTTRKSSFSETTLREEWTSGPTTEQNVLSSTKEIDIASDPAIGSTTTQTQKQVSFGLEKLDVGVDAYTTVENFETSTQTTTWQLPKTWDESAVEKSEESEELKLQEKEEDKSTENESKSNEAVLDWGFPLLSGFSIRTDIPTENVNSVESVEKTVEAEATECEEESKNEEKDQLLDDTQTLALQLFLDSLAENDKSEERSKPSEERSEDSHFNDEEKNDSTSMPKFVEDLAREESEEDIRQLVEAMEDPASDDFMIVDNSGSQWVKLPSWYEKLLLQHEKTTNLYDDYAEERAKSVGANSDESFFRPNEEEEEDDDEAEVEENKNSAEEPTRHIHWINFFDPQAFRSKEIQTSSDESEEESIERKNSKETSEQSRTSNEEEVQNEKELNFRTDESSTVDLNEDSSVRDKGEDTTLSSEAEDEARGSSEKPKYDLETSDVRYRTDESTSVESTTSATIDDYYEEFYYDEDYWGDYYVENSYRRWRRSLEDEDGYADPVPRTDDVEEAAAVMPNKNDVKSGVAEKDEIQKPPHLDTEESDTTVKRRKSRESSVTADSLDVSAVYKLLAFNEPRVHLTLNKPFPLVVVKARTTNKQRASNENARVRSENQEKK